MKLVEVQHAAGGMDDGLTRAVGLFEQEFLAPEVRPALELPPVSSGAEGWTPLPARRAARHLPKSNTRCGGLRAAPGTRNFVRQP